MSNLTQIGEGISSVEPSIIGDRAQDSQSFSEASIG
jgi:hypothetical protein